MANIKNFFKSVGNWFKNHIPTRRRIIQVYAALLTNANLKGFAEGQIYQNTNNITAVTKNLCTPGLNCYSCPGAVAACPLGALQNSLGESNTTTPFYILGILALFGLLLARTICGFLCPFGFIQDMLYKVKSPKVKKSVYTRLLSYLKYVLLITLVIAVPLIYHNVPGFCKYICPAGTFEGSVGLLSNQVNTDLYAMLSYLFSWKFVLLVMCIVLCIFIYRAFCRFICPLGAIYGFFNKISLLGVKLEKSKCIDCGMCISKCKMDIKHVGDHECINCGECISVCPTKAISWKGSKLFLEPTSVAVTASDAPVAEAPALNSILASGTTIQPVMAAESVTTSVADGTATVVLDEAPVAEEPVKEKSADESKPQMQKVKKHQRKKTKLILEIVAWSLASVLLIGALIYYNTLPPVIASVGKKLENFQAQTYQTAYGEDEFDLYDYYHYDEYIPDRKPTVFIFWLAVNDTSVSYLNDLGEYYEELQSEANIVVVHISDSRASAETVQSTIDANGWNEYNIPFLQDTEEIKIYNACGGEGAFPTVAFVNENIRLYSTYSRPMPKSEISSEIKSVVENTKYTVGDKIFDFTVDTYESSYKEGTFSSKSTEGKVLVINFWYVSCGPCVEELPFFEEVNKEYGDKVEMIAIHANNHEAGTTAQNFINAVNESKNKKSWADWKIIFGQDYGSSDIYFRFAISKGSYPVTIIVNPEGYITFTGSGAVINAHRDLLHDAINEALGESD